MYFFLLLMKKFGEWNCWNAYTGWTIYSLIHNNQAGLYFSIILALGVSANMYYCLVHWTGA